jgi:hypothetical protein
MAKQRNAGPKCGSRKQAKSSSRSYHLAEKKAALAAQRITTTKYGQADAREEPVADHDPGEEKKDDAAAQWRSAVLSETKRDGCDGFEETPLAKPRR